MTVHTPHYAHVCIHQYGFMDIFCLILFKTFQEAVKTAFSEDGWEGPAVRKDSLNLPAATLLHIQPTHQAQLYQRSGSLCQGCCICSELPSR